MKKGNKITNWVKKNKWVVIGSVTFGCLAALFYEIGRYNGIKISAYHHGRDMRTLTDAGVAKFFDPNTGDEITFPDAVDLLSNKKI